MINLCTKFEVSNSTHYEDTKGIQNIENGVFWGGQGHSRSLELVPYDRGNQVYQITLTFHSNYVPILHRF